LEQNIIKDIKTVTLLEKVSETQISFKNDVIEKFTEHDLPRDFISEEYWEDNAIIPVSKIIGTQHPDYIGLTWEELLHKGKRMYINLPLAEENPGYYYSDEKKLPTMSFNKYRDLYYVSGDGNHRSAIAKFLFHFSGETHLSGVTFYEYKVNDIGNMLNERLKDVIAKKALSLKVNTLRTATSREDGAGWKRDYFSTTLMVINMKTDEHEYFENPSENSEGDRLSMLINAIESHTYFTKWFSSNPFAKFIG
jgi:hypothetical protein